MWVATQQEYDKNASQYNTKRKEYSDHTHSTLLSQLDIVASSPSSLLEIGSGTGLLANMIYQKFPQSRYTGLELSPKMIDYSDRIWLPKNYQFIKWDFLEYSFDRRFDCIVSSSVLHFMNTQVAIQKCYDLLLPWWTAIILDWCNDGLFKPIDLWIRIFWSPDSHAVSSAQMKRFCVESWCIIKNHQVWWWKYRCLQCVVLRKSLK